MGYPIDLFLDENIDEEFLCAICHDVLQDVTMISACEHVFCKTCIHVWRQTKPTCPIDRQVMVKFQTPQRSFLNILGRLRLRCPFTSLGCTSTVNMGNVKEHEEKCEANPENQNIECPRGCGVNFKRRDGNRHVCPGNEAAADPAAAQAVPWVLPDGVPELLHQARNVWSGVLEWNERDAAGGSQAKEIQCSMMVAVANPRAPVTGTDWPGRMVMRLFPKRYAFTHDGRMYPGIFGESDYVHFAFPEGLSLVSLKAKLLNDYLGCVQLENPRKMCILVYCRRGDADFFVGIIPRHQHTLMHHLATVATLLRADRGPGTPAAAARRTPTVVLRDINRSMGAAATIAAAREARDSLIASRPSLAGSSVRIVIHRSDDPVPPRGLPDQPEEGRRHIARPEMIHFVQPSARPAEYIVPFVISPLASVAAGSEIAPPPPPVAPAQPAPANANSYSVQQLPQNRLRIRIRRSDIANARQALQETRIERVQRRIDQLERIRNDMRQIQQEQHRIANARSGEVPNPPPPTPEVATPPPTPSGSDSGPCEAEGGNCN